MGNDAARAAAQRRRALAAARMIPKGKSLVTSVPYLWLLLFFLIPFVIVLKISFSDTQIAMPPYQPLFSWAADQVLQVKLHLSNFAFLVGRPVLDVLSLRSRWPRSPRCCVC